MSDEKTMNETVFIVLPNINPLAEVIKGSAIKEVQTWIALVEGQTPIFYQYDIWMDIHRGDDGQWGFDTTLSHQPPSKKK